MSQLQIILVSLIPLYAIVCFFLLLSLIYVAILALKNNVLCWYM